MKGIFVLSVLLSICCGGGGQEQTGIETAEKGIARAGKSILMVIAPRDFRDEEFKEPHDKFVEAGYRITVASTDTATARGMLGMLVKPDITLAQIAPDSFDAIVIVGGSGSQVLWDDAALHHIVRTFDEQEKIVAAICIAPVVLARAGVLKDIRATVYALVKDEIDKCGGQYTGSALEVSGNIITCSGPSQASNFGAAIVRGLSK